MPSSHAARARIRLSQLTEPWRESSRPDTDPRRRTDRRRGHGLEQLSPGGGTHGARRAAGDRPAARQCADGRRPARRRHAGCRATRARDELPGPFRPAHRRPALAAGARGGNQRGAPAGLAAGLPDRRRERTGPSDRSGVRTRGGPPDLSRRRARPARLARTAAGDRRGRWQHRVHHRTRPGAAAYGERAGRLHRLDAALFSGRQAHPQALAARAQRDRRAAAAVRRGLPRSGLAGRLRLLRHRQVDRRGGAGDEVFRRRHHARLAGLAARRPARAGPDRRAEAARPDRGARAGDRRRRGDLRGRICRARHPAAARMRKLDARRPAVGSDRPRRRQRSAHRQHRRAGRPLRRGSRPGAARGVDRADAVRSGGESVEAGRRCA